MDYYLIEINGIVGRLHMGKYTKIWIGLLLLAFLCGGCSRWREDRGTGIKYEESNHEQQEDTIIDKEKQENQVIYVLENITHFQLGESGELYALNDKCNTFLKYNAEGGLIEDYIISTDKIITSYCYGNGMIYYIMLDTLYQYDLSSKESIVLYQFDGDHFSFKSMVWLNESIYIIRMNQMKDEQMEVRYDEEDEYSYEGEELLCYQISKNKMEYMEIPNLKLITRKNSEELLIYAYDSEGGFYFTSYDTNGAEFSENIYTQMQLGYIYNIAYDELLDKIICSNYKGIFVTSESDFKSHGYLYESTLGVGYSNSLQYQNGFTYELSREEGKSKLIKLNNSKLIEENPVRKEKPVLKAYTLSSSYNPEFLGYEIKYEELYETDLATILLSGDSDYDFVVLDASHQIAGNMRDIGAYHELSSVQGIEQYLGQCHEYIYTASKNGDGGIWMFPIEIDIPVLIYNEPLCKEYGFNIEAIDTYEKFIDQTIQLQDNDELHYNIPYYLMTIDITNKYIANYAITNHKSNFHTEVFQTYLEIMNQYDTRVNNGEWIFGEPIGSDAPHELGGLSKEEFEKQYFNNTLFDMIISTQMDNIYSFQYNKYDFFQVAAMPSLEEGKELKSIADCYFIVVNPNSKNIPYVEEYLSKLSENIVVEASSLMLKSMEAQDNRLKSDTHQIAKEAKILFAYPYEIISDEMRAYRLEGQSYEETVSEMERKMDMFLNE